ncbi:MAG: B12-binding domain-containing radical SAM protein, partial [Candidatus Riflebacteria bacterium]|nr:B12-binding domain-containing radical SAM protein [Candidatus Riflebacteria bacterium]
IPSLRMNDNTIKLLDETPQIRKGGLTFAPEAGTQRLRDVINKNITEEDIINVMKTTGDSEYRTVKLYFMMGLPFETDEDIEGLIGLVKRLEAIGRSTKPKKQISISLSGFIPKPFTPFQWAGQNSLDELKRKRVMVCKGLEGSSTKISWREEYLCLLEAVLARGDERVCDLILAAYQNGCKLDSWFEHFHKEGWEKAFEQTGIKAEDYTRSHDISEVLPWDFIDFQTPRAFFEKEYRLAAQIAGEELK